MWFPRTNLSKIRSLKISQLNTFANISCLHPDDWNILPRSSTIWELFLKRRQFCWCPSEKTRTWGSQLVLWLPVQFSSGMDSTLESLYAVGHQEVVCRGSDFLVFFHGPQCHTSMRMSPFYYRNTVIHTALISAPLLGNLTHPCSHSSGGRIALWLFHRLKMADKWQIWPRYLCGTTSRDALKFL